MPPRKSDVAKATSEEVAVVAPSTSTPAKETPHKEKDGVNIEVCGRSALFPRTPLLAPLPRIANLLGEFE